MDDNGRGRAERAARPSGRSEPPMDHNGPFLRRAGRSVDRIAAELRDAILTGTYGYQERLPAERDLARHFGASRGTVRAALLRLESQNLLTRRIGSGTFANHPPQGDVDDIADSTSPLELIEVRMALEPEICRLAALHATLRDVARLESCLARLEAAQERNGFSRADESFHLSLAQCTRNPLMIRLYRLVGTLRGHEQWRRMKVKILTPATIAAYNRQHRAIFEAIESRDADAASRAVKAHLEKARRDLLGAES